MDGHAGAPEHGRSSSRELIIPASNGSTLTMALTGRRRSVAKAQRPARTMRKADGRRVADARDPIALEVFSNALLSVAEEIGALLIRTAYSVNIKERHDA